MLPCPSIPSGSRPSSSALSRTRATPSPPPSRQRRSHSCWPAATCSPAPRPAPARRPRSSCRSSSGCTTAHAVGAAAPSRDPRNATRPPVRVLVLTPTRELALQVEESFRTYGAHRRVRSTAIYGGVGFEPQVRALRAGPSVVVATPGRLLDHAGQRTIDLSQVEVLVLDEADRMLDMGFIRDIRKILDLLPPRRQNLLFSATFSDEIRRLAGGLLDRPATVQVTPRNTAIALVSQLVLPVDRERKRELLTHLVKSGRVEQALVFTRTKHGANRLAEQLARDGIAATAIHGNKSQGQRVRALDDFKAGRASILVATEVASRGLDIEELPHVVNYELPMVAEDYIHRIGRTGRAGSTGDAISLVCVDEWPLLREIESLLGHRVPTEVIPGFEPDRSIRPEPIRQRSHGGQGRPMGARGGRPNVGRPTELRRRPTEPRPGPDRSGPRSPAAGRSSARARRSGAPAPAPRRTRARAAPRRGPAPVGIGNAPAGFRGPRPAAGPTAAGPTPQGRPHAGRPGPNRPAAASHGPGQHRPDRPTFMPGERLSRHRDG